MWHSAAHHCGVQLVCAGVDGSERIAEVAEQLVSANGLGKGEGGPISIVQGRLEQLANLPAEKVQLTLQTCRLCMALHGI